MKLGDKVMVKGEIIEIIEDKEGKTYKVKVNTSSMMYASVLVKEEELKEEEELKDVHRPV